MKRRWDAQHGRTTRAFYNLRRKRRPLGTIRAIWSKRPLWSTRRLRRAGASGVLLFGVGGVRCIPQLRQASPMPSGLSEFLWWSAVIAEWLIIVALSSVCFALDVDLPPKDQPELFMQSWVEFAHARPTLLGIALGVGILVVRIGRRLVENKRREVAILDRLRTETLDRFRDTCFPTIPSNEPKDLNRVTVFRHLKCLWWIWPFRGVLTPWGLGRGPWSGWLVVHCRSGHVTRGTRTAFLAPDDAQHSEGVAGQAWRRQAYRVGKGANKLPELKDVRYVSWPVAIFYNVLLAISAPTTNAKRFAEERTKVTNYAEATHCRPRFVWQRIKRKTPCPVALLAVPLLNKNREPWGVVVMDSCNQYECIDTDSREFRTAFTKLEQQLHSLGVTDE